MMTANEFVDIAKAIQKSKTVYALGTYGQNITKSLVTAKTKQYPAWYTTHDLTAYTNNGHRGYDCCGLVKGILWGATDTKQAKYGSNGVPDNGTESIYKDLKNKCKPSEAKPGYILHMQGHVGIYIGDGKVIEATGGSKRCVALTSINYQKWTGAGESPYLIYDNKPEPKPEPPAPTPTPTPAAFKVGNVVKIKKGAIYGGLSKDRGKKVPDWVTTYEYKITQLATHRGEKEALLSRIVSWVAEKYLYKK